jgi:putative transposase
MGHATATVKVNAARKYRAYPTEKQADTLTGWGHTCRALYNLALEQREYVWQQRGRPMRGPEQSKFLTKARAEMDWVADLPAQSGQQVLANLDRAYDNWRNPEHPAEAPTFHKRWAPLSIPFPGQAIQVRKLSRKWAEVRLPKLGWVRFRLSRPLGGVVRNATLSRDAQAWHVSFGIAADLPPAVPNGLPGVGVDFGVACSAFCSDEAAPRLMAPSLTPGEQRRLLGLEQRKARQITFAKKHNGGTYSKRLRRTIAQIAGLRARQARRRKDFTHKLTTDLAKSHGWVAIEDLRVKNMTKTAKGTKEKPGTNVAQKAGLNRAILDNAWGERRRQLGYKAARHGSELRVVPASGTSQTCSECHVRDPQSRPGCGRVFACTVRAHGTCGLERSQGDRVQR